MGKKVLGKLDKKTDERREVADIIERIDNGSEVLHDLDSVIKEIRVTRTSFERDSTGEHAELFLKVRDYIKTCIGNGAKEKQSANITTLHSREGGFCYIRVKDDYIHIGWLRGRHLQDPYNLLFGKAKTIRGQKVHKLDKTTRDAIRHYVQETLMFLFEHNALKELKKRR